MSSQWANNQEVSPVDATKGIQNNVVLNYSPNQQPSSAAVHPWDGGSLHQPEG